MKNVLKRSLALLLTVTIIFSSAYVGLGDVGFNGLFTVKAKAAGGVKQKLDSVIMSYPSGSQWTGSFDGGTQCFGFAKMVIYQVFGQSDGKYRSWTYAGGSDSGMTCVGSITSFSSANVKNLLNNAKCGDVLQFNTTKQHTMIVYSVESDGVWIYDCNWDWKCGIRLAKVTFGSWSGRDSTKLTLLRSNNYDEIDGPSHTMIEFWSVSNTDGTDAGIDSSTTFTIRGKNKFWFKEYDTDTNYYIDLFLDNTQLLSHASSDVNGYVSVDIDAATITPGLHTLTADLYDTNAKYSVSKQFYSAIPDNQCPVFSEVKVASIAEDGYMVTAKVSDNIGVTEVRFPTWISGQTGYEANWLPGSYNSSTGLWECWVPVSNWGGHYGTYYTHVYAYDAAGNSTCYTLPEIRVPSINSYSDELASSRTYDLSQKTTIYAAGWAYNRNGDNVQFYYRFDNGLWYAFDLIDRIDITNTFSDCAQTKCGYSKNISIADLSAGQHIIDVIVSTNGMTKVVASSIFTVVRPESYVYFDINDGSNKNINLLAPQKATETIDGITYSYDGETGIMTLNGSSPADIDIFSKPFTTVNGDVYKVSVTYVSGSVSNGCLVLEARDNGTERLNFDMTNGSASKTWTVTSTQAKNTKNLTLWAWHRTGAGNLTFLNYKVKIKLEKVSLSSASATGYTPNAKYLAYGQVYSTMPVISRSGYTFNGWYTAKAGGTKVLASTVFKSGTSQTLYAHWTANKYTVTFNANGGSCSTANKSVTYDSTYGTLPTPTRTAYTFDGWYTSANGGTKITSSSAVAITSAQTLYAHWIANNYTANFNENGTRVRIIPSSDKSVEIAEKDFFNNTSIQSVKIEDGVTAMGDMCFSGCSKLTKIIIPESVTEIGESVFEGCENFTIYCYDNSAVKQYAEDNKIPYVLVDLRGTDGTRIEENGVIYMNQTTVDKIDSIVTVSEEITLDGVPGWVYGGKAYYGTDSKISLLVDNWALAEYTVVVCGDLNGDSVVDVLDIAKAERASNKKEEIEGAYLLAGDFNSNEEVDVADFQQLINIALSE